MDELNKIRQVTSHIPNGWFIVLYKAFRPLKLYHGLTAESPAISHWAYACRYGQVQKKENKHYN